MQDHWIGKNVDLARLSDDVEAFLSKKGFETRKDRLKHGYAVSGTPLKKDQLSITVEVVGQPNDFVIRFFYGERPRSYSKLGFLMTFFGGGTLLLRSLQSSEEFEKLEKEFWPTIDDTIERLFDSAVKGS